MNNKMPTGIPGLDTITHGGLPEGRATLVCGGPGCGKTVLAMQILVHGAVDYGEPGLFVSFEESPAELAADFAATGFQLEALQQRELLTILHIELKRDEIVEMGEFTLDALRIRIDHAIKAAGARRVVLDSLDALFSALTRRELLRAEVGRLLEWLTDQGVTVVITGERGDGELTRHGFEAYVSDCVILLDQRVAGQLVTRRLRIVKCRGSAHESDEFPFFIDDSGASLLPITSLDLVYDAPTDRVGSGVGGLDAILHGGYLRAGIVLATGTPGSGKSSTAAAFAAAAADRDERCLYLALEESPAELLRNMRSIGIDLQPAVDRGVLRIDAFRPTTGGLESHLLKMIRAVDSFEPECVVIDPVTAFVSVGDLSQVGAMLARALHLLKGLGITVFMTALAPDLVRATETQLAVSSISDTWLQLSVGGDSAARHRRLRIVKSRGTEHVLDDLGLHISSTGLSVAAPEGREDDAGRT